MAIKPRRRVRRGPRPKGVADIPRLLREFDQDYPGRTLKGAILLLKINREADNLISPAMGLCWRYHWGSPSPWSHNVLITGAYDRDMRRIPILDCTIRTKEGKVDWDQKLLGSIGKPIDKQGGIYAGTVAEYCDEHVTLAGIKFLHRISDSARDAIVNAGKALYARRHYYDIPGLFRALARFASGDQVMLPGSRRLLFCSAFCQKAYMDADHRHQFAKKFKEFHAVPADLTTDDDVWYSELGTRFPETVRLPRKAALKSLYAAGMPAVRRTARGPRP
jgi:hypothetical protein